jgi:hypothetical protein
MTLPTDLPHGFRRTEFQAMRGADRNTGRFQSVIDAVFTEIAFDNLADFGVPLWRTPWTSRDTGFTTHTQGMIHKNNAVLQPFLHGTGRAGRHTPGIFTVKAGHEYVRSPGKTADKSGTDGHDLTEFGAGRQQFGAFTLYLATVASDAFLFILKQVKFAHYPSP